MLAACRALGPFIRPLQEEGEYFGQSCTAAWERRHALVEAMDSGRTVRDCLDDGDPAIPRSLGHASQFLAKNNMQPRQIAKLTKVRATVAACAPLAIATTVIAGTFGCIAASQQRRLSRNTGTLGRMRVVTE